MSLALLMKREIKKISVGTTIQEAARIMGIQKVGSLFVEKEGQLVGILTETDVVRKAAAKGLDLKKDAVESIISKPIISIELTRSPQDAFDLMGEVGIRHLGITERGKIVGVLSVRDLLVYFKKQSEPRMGID
ncbi:MAG TPA: CBS domain-containing protein [Nitrospiria bacterium]|nr:CBS domain-containing protein [Nitrospiria bacterium]